MHRKHIFLGFLIGLAVGAYYHWANKSTPKDQDSLYKLVARVRGKVAEAQDEDSELHAAIVKNAAKVKEAGAEVGAAAKDSAEDITAKARAKVLRGAEEVRSRAEATADDAAAKVQKVADAAAAHADERTKEV